MIDTIFNSMEQYLIVDAELTDNRNVPDREAIKTEERRLLRTLDDLGIDKYLFLQNRRYVITEYVEELFEYIRLYFQERYHDQLKGKKFSEISQRDLVEVRVRLLDALYSLEMDPNSVKEAVEKYEKVTKCPVITSRVSFSALTVEAVNYWKEDYEDIFDKIEWDQFTALLEDHYRHDFRSNFIEFTLNLLKDFAKAHGKELPEESYGLPEIPAGISSDSPSTKTDNQSE